MKITGENEITLSAREAEELGFLNEGLAKFREWLQPRLQQAVREYMPYKANYYLSIQIADQERYNSLEYPEL